MAENVKRGRSGTKLDSLGVAASLLCAAHCALLPVAMALLPAIGLGFLGSEAAERSLFGLSATLGIISLTLGYRRHRVRAAVGLLSIGLALFAAGRLAEAFEAEVLGVASVVLGGLVVASAHLVNRHFCALCPACGEDGQMNSCRGWSDLERPSA